MSAASDTAREASRLVAFEREVIRRGGLREFIRQAWAKIDPAPFRDTWHIGAMAEFLTAVFDREIRFWVINIPPGCSKTRVVASLYPAWCWTLDPKEKFMCASYSASLSAEAARMMRDLVASEWYQRLWPAQIVGNKVGDFRNSHGGRRLSTTIGGQSTGFHATQRIIDDPIKPLDTMGAGDVTRKKIQAVDNWYAGTWSTRTADARRITDGTIMQRLHDADLAGRMIEKGAEVLMLPMRYEPKRACYVRGVKLDPRTEPGELLVPERFSEEAVKKLEVDLGNFASAQLQQDPVDSAGGIFKREWFQFWSPDGKIPGTVALPPCYVQMQSWDCNFVEGGDYVVGQCWGRHEAQFFLLDQVRERWGFGATCEAMLRFSALHPKAITKYVEKKANGAAVIETMQKAVPGIQAVEPDGGKEARANAVSGLPRSGSVFLPHPSLAPWVNDFLNEVVRFPKAPNDDQVDAMTQALKVLYARVPRLVEAAKKLRENPDLAAALAGVVG